MLEFKKWFMEYQADLDYDVSDPHSILLPTRRTIVHDIAADIRDDFGKVFAKRMGSGMSHKAVRNYINDDPIKIFNNNQYLIATVELPMPNTGIAQKDNLRNLMNKARQKVQSDPRVEELIQKGRCKLSDIQDINKNLSSEIINKNGQRYIKFTFRFKMNDTLGPGFKADDMHSATDIATSR